MRTAALPAAYAKAVERCYKKMGRQHPADDVLNASSELSRLQQAGIPASVAAGITDATLHHAHPKHTVMTEVAPQSRAKLPALRSRRPAASGKSSSTIRRSEPAARS